MSHIPPLAAVRVFEAAARHGNFSRAGEELAMTQSAVSYQMKLLEERLGGPLFVRNGRAMELTALGRRIAPQVTEAFALLGKAFAAARSENEAILSITAPQTFATNWLSSRIGDFNLVRPDLAVRLNVTDTMVDLNSSEYDVAIRGMPARGSPEWQPGLIAHFLMQMPITPLAHPDFLARHPIKDPADLPSTGRVPVAGIGVTMNGPRPPRLRRGAINVRRRSGSGRRQICSNGSFRRRGPAAHVSAIQQGHS